MTMVFSYLKVEVDFCSFSYSIGIMYGVGVVWMEHCSALYIFVVQVHPYQRLCMSVACVCLSTGGISPSVIVSVHS